MPVSFLCGVFSSLQSLDGGTDWARKSASIAEPDDLWALQSFNKGADWARKPVSIAESHHLWSRLPDCRCEQSIMVITCSQQLSLFSTNTGCKQSSRSPLISCVSLHSTSSHTAPGSSSPNPSLESLVQLYSCSCINCKEWSPCLHSMSLTYVYEISRM
jgi:hypothetical protein